LCYKSISSILLNFKVGHNTNTSNVTLLLAAGNVTDEI